MVLVLISAHQAVIISCATPQILLLASNQRADAKPINSVIMGKRVCNKLAFSIIYKFAQNVNRCVYLCWLYSV